MRRRLLIGVLLLVCFWHFNVNAAETLIGGVTASAEEVTETQNGSEEIEEVFEENNDEQENASSDSNAPPDQNVFLDGN